MNEDILKLAKECASGHPVSTFLCNRLTARAWSPWLETFYRAAYNAGLEAAADNGGVEMTTLAGCMCCRTLQPADQVKRYAGMRRGVVLRCDTCQRFRQQALAKLAA